MPDISEASSPWRPKGGRESPCRPSALDVPVTPPTHADAHTKDADRVKSGLSLAYLPPSDLKLSVSDEEKKAEGLNRDHSASERLPDFRKASSLNPQPADYGEKHWWERESVGEVLQEKEKR